MPKYISNDLPEGGRIVVVAPEVAPRLYEQSPLEFKDRIYTIQGIDPETAYVIDLDEMEKTLLKSFEGIRYGADNRLG